MIFVAIVKLTIIATMTRVIVTTTKTRVAIVSDNSKYTNVIMTITINDKNDDHNNDIP